MPDASNRKARREGVDDVRQACGPWLGEKIAGPNKDAKGASRLWRGGAGRRSIPALAALALGGWATGNGATGAPRTPSYPSEAHSFAAAVGLSGSLEIRLDRARNLSVIGWPKRSRLRPAATRIQPSETQYSIDVGLFLAVEADAHAAAQQRLVEKRGCAGRARGGRAGCRRCRRPCFRPTLPAPSTRLNVKVSFTRSCRLARAGLSARSRHMSDKDPSAAAEPAQLALHVPEPPFRPGDTPDFSIAARFPPPASAPRPDDARPPPRLTR